MESKDRLKPVTGFRFSRRILPHFEIPGSIYFITFSTLNRFHLSDSAKEIVLSSFRFYNGKKYSLHVCVIMDDHAHCILQPMQVSNKVQARSPVQLNTLVPAVEYYSLAQIAHSIKSYSANRLQKMSNHKQRIWQDENFDRIVRDSEKYAQKMNYVIYNPVKAGFVEQPGDYKWLFFGEKALSR
jgi:REP element-mobilizing transposase RayT